MPDKKQRYIRVTVAFDSENPVHMDIYKSLAGIRLKAREILPETDLSSDSALIRTIIYNFAEYVLGSELKSPDELDTRLAVRQLTEQLNRFAGAMERSIKGLYAELEKVQSAPKSYFTTDNFLAEQPPDVFGAFDDDDE
jgi:hypothetical protein